MSPIPPAGPPLDDDEIRQLAILLARYAAHKLDQFDHWSVETPHGTAFIEIARKLPQGVGQDSYHLIWPLPPHLVERKDAE
jgi:hypothetical protein